MWMKVIEVYSLEVREIKNTKSISLGPNQGAGRLEVLRKNLKSLNVKIIFLPQTLVPSFPSQCGHLVILPHLLAVKSFLCFCLTKVHRTVHRAYPDRARIISYLKNLKSSLLQRLFKSCNSHRSRDQNIDIFQRERDAFFTLPCLTSLICVNMFYFIHFYLHLSHIHSFIK